MQNGQLEYSAWIDDAMRLIVKRALESVRDEGLPGNHHFFISFITHYEGVSLSDALLERYPEEMTVVLQFQFSNLYVTDTFFSVELSFDGVSERVVVPFNAIVAFADPSVKFGLQFRRQDAVSSRAAAEAKNADEASVQSAGEAQDRGDADAFVSSEGEAGGEGEGTKTKGPNVISLAKYRNSGQNGGGSDSR